MKMQLIRQGYSKKSFYKWLHSEVVLYYGRMKQPLYPSGTLGTMSLGDAGLFGVHAVPDSELSTGTTILAEGPG